MVSGLTFKSLIHFELMFMTGKIRVQFHSSVCGYPIFLTPFIEETVLSLLCILGSLTKD